MLKFKEYTAKPVKVEAIELDEKAWRKLRREGCMLLNGNMLTAFELGNEKLFFLGDDFDLFKDGATVLHLGDFLVSKDNRTFIYTQEEFTSLYY